MKKIFLLLLISFTFFGCAESDSIVKCYAAVQNAYPNCSIYRLPRHNYTYIVTDTCGMVLYVETMSIDNTKITSEIIISRGK